MQVSYEWLLNYLPEPIPIEELSEILTSIGLEVEHIETVEAIKGGLNGVVVGKVLTCEQHPNADKLKVTTVDVGNPEPLSIVCGAPNVSAGQKVMVATVGTKLYPDGGALFEIKPAKIRGEKSFGMLCAEDELGIGKSHEGIMELPEDTKVGTSAAAYLALPPAQHAIHIGLTPNRSDAMSHIGVVRDVCAYLSHHRGEKRTVNMPAYTLPEQGTVKRPFTIKIEQEEKCKRYAGITIANVKVAESPEWLKQKLIAVGLRPINNVVDVTNFVLQELGQPLHAFDYAKISGGAVVVKSYSDPTSFLTLDEKECQLGEEDLMIANTQEPMCMAGVMGGATSGVTATTQDVFLESAWFDPISVRRSSMKHLLRTDAATRFEKTANIDMVIPALERAASLICELTGGTIASTVTDVYPEVKPKEEVTFKYEYIHRLCGKEYGKDAIDTILTALGFVIQNADNESCTVQVPFTKNDVAQPADIAEEILRIDGLNNVPVDNKISFAIPEKKESTARQIKYKMCEWLSNNGFNEIITNSIIDANNYDVEEDKVVKMLNSLSTIHNAMRPKLMESGLEVIAYNVNRNAKDLLFFELGNVYGRRKDGAYFQNEKLGIWITGNRIPKQWLAAEQHNDAYYLKGVIEALAKSCGILKWKTRQQEHLFNYLDKKKPIAFIQEVSKAQLKKAGIKQKVYYAEIDIENWIKVAQEHTIQFQEVNKYPTVSRDLALVLDQEVTFAEIEKATNQTNINDLKAYQLFDIYKGTSLGADKQSWAINYQFESKNKTFTDEDIDGFMKKLIAVYTKNLKAEIRE